MYRQRSRHYTLYGVKSVIGRFCRNGRTRDAVRDTSTRGHGGSTSCSLFLASLSLTRSFYPFLSLSPPTIFFVSLARYEILSFLKQRLTGRSETENSRELFVASIVPQRGSVPHSHDIIPIRLYTPFDVVCLLFSCKVGLSSASFYPLTQSPLSLGSSLRLSSLAVKFGKLRPTSGIIVCLIACGNMTLHMACYYGNWDRCRKRSMIRLTKVCVRFLHVETS